MDHNDHVLLLAKGIPTQGGVWADLGSGAGAFTLALADVFQLTDLFIKAYRASLALISYNDGWVPIQLLGKQLMRLDQGYREPFGNMNLTTLIKKRPELFEIQLRSPNSQIEVRLRSQASGAPTASTE